MILWNKPKYRASLAKSLVISGLALVLAVGASLYLIWYQGMNSVFGIPLQFLLVTIAFPVLLAALIFWLARKLDELAWLDDDEK